MKKGRFLYKTNLKEFKLEDPKNSIDVDFSVYGIFDTEKVTWTYYVISSVPDGSSFNLTPHICCCRLSCMSSYDNISTFGRKVKTKEEGVSFIQEFKDKWEFGSNDTRQEKRDQKIDDVLGGDRK